METQNNMEQNSEDSKIKETGDIFQDSLGLVPNEPAEVPPTEATEAPPIETPPPVVEPEKTAFNETEWLKEKTGGKYENLENILSEVEKLSKTPSGSLTELSKKIDAACEEKYGVTYKDIVDLKSKNFDEMDETDVYTEHLLFSDPDITDQEIEAKLLEYEILFKSNEEIEGIKDDMDEKEKQDFDKRLQVLNAKFTSEIRKAKRELTEFRDSLSLDEIILGAEEQVQKQPQISAEEIAESFYSSLNDYKDSVAFKTDNGDEVKIDIALSDDEKKSLSNIVGNWTNWQSERWIDNEGKLKVSQMTSDLDKIINAEKREKLVYNQGIAAGQKMALKDINNLDFDKKQTSSDAKTPSVLEQIAGDLIN